MADIPSKVEGVKTASGTLWYGILRDRNGHLRDVRTAWCLAINVLNEEFHPTPPTRLHRRRLPKRMLLASAKTALSWRPGSIAFSYVSAVFVPRDAHQTEFCSRCFRRRSITLFTCG